MDAHPHGAFFRFVQAEFQRCTDVASVAPPQQRVAASDNLNDLGRFAGGMKSDLQERIQP